VSTQRLIRLLLSHVVLTVFALLSERSQALSAINAAAPLKGTIALCFVFSDLDRDLGPSANPSKTALIALIPTAILLLACVFGL